MSAWENVRKWMIADEDTVSVPRDALKRLVDVARWVVALTAPDGPRELDSRPTAATARRALGALDDAGLLDQFREDSDGRGIREQSSPAAQGRLFGGLRDRRDRR